MRIGYVMESGAVDVRARQGSGPAAHVRHTVQGLRELGHDVRLVARLDGGIWRTDDLRHFDEVEVRRPALAESAIRRLQASLRLPYLSHFDSRRFADACVHTLKACDLLYERLGWMSRGGGMAAARLGVPHVLEINGDHLAELRSLGLAPGLAQRLVSTWLMRRTVQRAAHSIATGEGWRTRFVRCWRVNAGAVSVVDNGSELVDLLDRQQLRCFLDQGDCGPLPVAFVGSFDPWQNVPMLLSATARVVQDGVDLRVTLAGTGRQEAAIRERVARLGLTGRVRMAGFLAPRELAECLRSCEVGVSLYTGRPEHRGLKILDYKAAGLATIATGADGEPRLIGHGVTGIIIPPDDEAALCAALVEMASRRGRTREMGRQARAEAESRHRWRNTAESLSALFADVLLRHEWHRGHATVATV